MFMLKRSIYYEVFESTIKNHQILVHAIFNVIGFSLVHAIFNVIGFSMFF